MLDNVFSLDIYLSHIGEDMNKLGGNKKHLGIRLYPDMLDKIDAIVSASLSKRQTIFETLLKYGFETFEKSHPHIMEEVKKRKKKNMP